MATTTYEGTNNLQSPALSERPSIDLPNVNTIYEVPPLHIVQTVISERRRLEAIRPPVTGEAALAGSHGTLTAIRHRHAEARKLASAVARS